MEKLLMSAIQVAKDSGPAAPMSSSMASGERQPWARIEAMIP